MITEKIQLSTCTEPVLLSMIKRIQTSTLNRQIESDKDLETSRIILEIFQERELKITTVRNDDE